MTTMQKKQLIKTTQISIQTMRTQTTQSLKTIKIPIQETPIP